MLFILLGFAFKSTTSALVHRLLDTGYNSGDRPVLNENDAVNLTIIANALTLLRMDQAEETAIFSAEFILEWKDAFLKWDPAEFDGQKRVKLKEIQIWRPDVTVSTSIAKESLLDANERYVDVFYDGLVRQSVYAVYTNLCNMKVNEFPYDSQVCLIDIGPWSYTDEEVHSIPGKSIESPYIGFEGNSEWDFTKLLSSEKRSCDSDADFHYTEVRFELYIERRPQFYLWVLLIPTFVITTVSICGLFIPTNTLGDREEKVNLGLTTLLSSAVILEIVANSMPKASALPLLGNFILAEIFVVAAGVVCSVITLTFHHRANTRKWKPKPWMMKILGMTGSRKFFLSSCRRMDKPEKNASAMLMQSSPWAEFLASLRSLLSYLDEEEVDRLRELAWLKLFDRLDFVLLIVFLIGNCIVTIVVCSH
ncbi:Neurotransmitter-gated ion-channel ligand binding domain protein [Ancylostoma caninum]|uniref:Neurotransmitter-gated ion-channel ligand binding domain protein n=1 Tax=Ancylostoma caninum TaxID=29170 RepID=A0A368G0X9_ANCCA|nr:Neurotransmitter-gated ion-channel ligand binding domain protein [Ancylostoma caninum]